jgi:glycine hydroxymethyltransferase
MRIIDIIDKHEARRSRSINLVASENLMSPEACNAMQSDLTNRYCMPDENNRPADMWDYPNQEYTRAIAAQTEKYVLEIFGGSYADVRPLSGNNVAYIILKSLVPLGGNVFSVAGSNGGHFTASEICRREGFNNYYLPYDEAVGNIDIRNVRELVSKVKPDLVFLDASMQLFPYPVKELREVFGDDVIISYDASHTMGLIAGGSFQSPFLEGADIVHGSTHKSLFGPQKGLIVCKNDEHHPDRVSARIKEIVSPLFVSNMHIHNVAALGVALEEMLEFGEYYSKQVIKNAKAFAKSLHDEGIDILYPEKDYTESHQVICRMKDKDDMKNSMSLLENINVHVNGIKIPYSGGFGFRLGISEVTRRGMVEKDIIKLAKIVADCLFNRKTADILRAQINELSGQFNNVEYCFTSLPKVAEVKCAE